MKLVLGDGRRGLVFLIWEGKGESWLEQARCMQILLTVTFWLPLAVHHPTYFACTPPCPLNLIRLHLNSIG